MARGHELNGTRESTRLIVASLGAPAKSINADESRFWQIVAFGDAESLRAVARFSAARQSLNRSLGEAQAEFDLDEVARRVAEIDRTFPQGESSLTASDPFGGLLGFASTVQDVDVLRWLAESEVLRNGSMGPVRELAQERLAGKRLVVVPEYVPRGRLRPLVDGLIAGEARLRPTPEFTEVGMRLAANPGELGRAIRAFEAAARSDEGPGLELTACLAAAGHKPARDQIAAVAVPRFKGDYAWVGARAASGVPELVRGLRQVTFAEGFVSETERRGKKSEFEAFAEAQLAAAKLDGTPAAIRRAGTDVWVGARVYGSFRALEILDELRALGADEGLSGLPDNVLIEAASFGRSTGHRFRDQVFVGRMNLILAQPERPTELSGFLGTWLPVHPDQAVLERVRLEARRPCLFALYLVESLLAAGDPVGVELAKGELGQPNSSRVLWALRIVRREPSIDLLPSLVALVDHPRWRVRLEVARALRAFDNPEADRLLDRLAKDPAYDVRRAARGLRVTAAG